MFEERDRGVEGHTDPSTNPSPPAGYGSGAPIAPVRTPDDRTAHDGLDSSGPTPIQSRADRTAHDGLDADGPVVDEHDVDECGTDRLGADGLHTRIRAAVPDLSSLPAPHELPGFADPDDDEAFLAAVEIAERLARAAGAWRDRVVAAAHAEGLRRRHSELTPSESPGQARQWAEREITAELATLLRIAEPAVGEQVLRTRELTTEFPRLAAMYARGEVSRRQANALLDVFTECDSSTKARADAELTDRAGGLTAGKLRVAARRWRARATSAAHERVRATLVMKDRQVSLKAADDHMTWLNALLPAVQAHAIFDRLTAIAGTARASEADPRTLAQVRADAMAALLLDDEARETAIDEGGHVVLHAARAACGRETVGEASPAGGMETGSHGLGIGSRDVDDGAAGITMDDSSGAWPTGSLPPDWARGIRPTVILTVPVLPLLGHPGTPGDGPAVLEGHGPIDIDTARALAAHAPSFIRVLPHPETGAVLSVGRDAYTPPADLRKALIVRDGTCRFPGCARPAVRCDLDHTTDWAAGGCTSAGNLAHLCRAHHRLKHHTRWRAEHLGAGVLQWISPSGRTYTTAPVTCGWPPKPPPPRRPAPSRPPMPSPRDEWGSPPF